MISHPQNADSALNVLLTILERLVQPDADQKGPSPSNPAGPLDRASGLLRAVSSPEEEAEVRRQLPDLQVLLTMRHHLPRNDHRLGR